MHKNVYIHSAHSGIRQYFIKKKLVFLGIYTVVQIVPGNMQGERIALDIFWEKGYDCFTDEYYSLREESK